VNAAADSGTQIGPQIGLGMEGVFHAYDETESLFVVDLISHYPLSKDMNIFAKAENVFDEQKIIKAYLK